MTKSNTIGVRVQVSLDKIENMLYSAGDASNYWCSGAEDLKYEDTVRGIIDGHTPLKLKLLDDELNGKDRGFILDMTRIKKGLAVMAKKEPLHFADMMSEQGDMYTGDAFLQCALLGSVVYS